MFILLKMCFYENFAKKRGDTIKKLFAYRMGKRSQDDIKNTMEVDCIDNDVETKEECGNCKSKNAKNECDKCGKYFCKNCEYKVGGEESESVMEFFKSRNFVNYTCTTAHFSENSK